MAVPFGKRRHSGTRQSLDLGELSLRPRTTCRKPKRPPPTESVALVDVANFCRGANKRATNRGVVPSWRLRESSRPGLTSVNEIRKALSHLDLANAGGYEPLCLATIRPSHPRNRGDEVVPLSPISYNEIPPLHPLQPLLLCLEIRLSRTLHARPSLLLGQGRWVFAMVMMMSLRVRATPAENRPIPYLAPQNSPVLIWIQTPTWMATIADRANPTWEMFRIFSRRTPT